MLSLRGNAFNDYHLPSDTPEHVDWQSVDRCLQIAEATVRRWAAGVGPASGALGQRRAHFGVQPLGQLARERGQALHGIACRRRRSRRWPP